MKKLMVVMLLALALCLSACTKAPQTNAPLKPAQSETGQTAPAPAPIAPEEEPDGKSDVVHHESAPGTPEEEKPAEVIRQEAVDEQAVDAPSPDAATDKVTESTDTMQSHPETEEPAADTEPEQTMETETAPIVTELRKEDIFVNFQSELVELDTPYRVYSPMFTRTQDSYYAIDPDAVFTVTNNGTNEEAYLIISIGEWIRSAESFISVVNHDGELLEMDMLGEYWNDDESFWLSNQTSAALSAGENLCWAKMDSEGNRPQQTIKLFPGESVTFHLPEREQDTICCLIARYLTDTEDFGLPSCSFWVTADDVRTPSTTVVP